jgi:hypothetical protein
MSKAMKKEVAITENGGQIAPASESASLISMIERAARDPAVDIDKMERLFQMRERMLAQEAKAAYLTALAAMQKDLPIVDKKGVINRNEKDAQGNRTGTQKEQRYAKWEDINEAIIPVLAQHGFSLSHRIEQPTPDRLSVTAILGHRQGHSEQTSISLPFDGSGGKNNMHGWGSAASYGKRYTSIALLNITARGEDDDGKAAGADAKISTENVEKVRSLLMETNSDLAAFYNLFGIECLEDLPQAKLDTALKMLELKKSKRR